jgi:hypothetical protein
MSAPVSHPLALASAGCHPWHDAVVAADALGRAVDARIAALSVLTEPTGAARDEIRAVLAEFGRAAGSVSGGEFSAYWTWYRGGISAIRREADRLFAGEAWVGDVRGPNWTPL